MQADKRDTAFKALPLPGNDPALIPADLTILVPKAPRIPAEDRHYLAYIPRQTKYLDHIPLRYQPFFRYVLPSLHARTSNVHTALSIAQLPFFIDESDTTIDRRLVYLALILHDCGWSKVSQEGLVLSLKYNGVAPSNPDSRKPKQQHLIHGESLAYELLDAYDYGDEPLTSEEIYTISEIIRRHDHDAAWEIGKYGHIRQEVRIVCDADRLWSYTYENFWLDTVRKGVDAVDYLETITKEIPTYFFTAPGRARARQLVAERRQEVACYQSILRDADKLSVLTLNARHPSKRILLRSRQLLHSARSRQIQRSLIRQKAY